MALAFDAVASATTNAGSTTPTFAHTCSGSDRVLFVWVSQRLADAVTGVTYAGVALTQLATVADAFPVTSCSLWRLIAPASGANNVVVTLSAVRNAVLVAKSFTGADQTDPDGTPVTGGDASGPDALVVSSAAGEIVADCVGLMNDSALGGRTLTVGADQTERVNTTDGGATAIRTGCSTEPGAASVTMSWTPSTADDWSGIAVAVKPAGAAPSGRPGDMLLLGCA